MRVLIVVLMQFFPLFACRRRKTQPAAKLTGHLKALEPGQCVSSVVICDGVET
jgi:hypothetical protein